jgi:hypothetical protein
VEPPWRCVWEEIRVDDFCLWFYNPVSLSGLHSASLLSLLHSRNLIFVLIAGSPALEGLAQPSIFVGILLEGALGGSATFYGAVHAYASCGSCIRRPLTSSTAMPRMCPPQDLGSPELDSARNHLTAARRSAMFSVLQGLLILCNVLGNWVRRFFWSTVRINTLLDRTGCRFFQTLPIIRHQCRSRCCQPGLHFLLSPRVTARRIPARSTLETCLQGYQGIHLLHCNYLHNRSSASIFGTRILPLFPHIGKYLFSSVHFFVSCFLRASNHFNSSLFHVGTKRRLRNFRCAAIKIL